MSHDVLLIALAKRDRLTSEIERAQRQIDEWQQELARIIEFVATWRELSAEVAEEAPPQTPERQRPKVARPTVKRAKRTLNNSKKEEVAEASRIIIQEKGGWISRGDLLIALRERGLVIEGADPENVLGTMLWRMTHRVAKRENGGYSLPEAKPAGL